jgi:hypothetical protein
MDGAARHKLLALEARLSRSGVWLPIFPSAFRAAQPEMKYVAARNIFAAGTKVYCYPPLWGDGYEKIKVVGRHRGSKRYVEMIVAAKTLASCRVKLVYSPYLLDHLSGFWDETAKSKKKAEELADR